MCPHGFTDILVRELLSLVSLPPPSGSSFLLFLCASFRNMVRQKKQNRILGLIQNNDVGELRAILRSGADIYKRGNFQSPLEVALGMKPPNYAIIKLLTEGDLLKKRLYIENLMFLKYCVDNEGAWWVFESYTEYSYGTAQHIFSLAMGEYACSRS